MNTNDPYGSLKHQKKQALSELNEKNFQMGLIEILDEMRKMSKAIANIEKRMEQYQQSH